VRFAAVTGTADRNKVTGTGSREQPTGTGQDPAFFGRVSGPGRWLAVSARTYAVFIGSAVSFVL
jgi:hypothetical protein